MINRIQYCSFVHCTHCLYEEVYCFAQVDEVMAFSSPHDELGETVAIAVPAGESMLDLKELRKRPSKLSTLAPFCWLRRRQCRLAEVVSFANAGGQLAGSAQPSFRRCSSLHQSCQGPMGLVSCSEWGLQSSRGYRAWLAPPYAHTLSTP